VLYHVHASERDVDEGDTACGMMAKARWETAVGLEIKWLREGMLMTYGEGYPDTVSDKAIWERDGCS
jgi:hypothetical protein